MDGKKAVRIARRTIELWIRNRERRKPEDYPPEFDEKSGVFVTIHSYPKRQLRGCIGFPEPIYPLIRALQEVAILAATDDPRFPPLSDDDLDKIVIEVSILTKPERIQVKATKEYIKHIQVGKDGLIVRKGIQSGLLLPQVATEYGWGPEEFLAQTCMKAGLPPQAWIEKSTEVYKFRSLIFSEKKPGKI